MSLTRNAPEKDWCFSFYEALRDFSWIKGIPWDSGLCLCWVQGVLLQSSLVGMVMGRGQTEQAFQHNSTPGQAVSSNWHCYIRYHLGWFCYTLTCGYQRIFIMRGFLVVFISSWREWFWSFFLGWGDISTCQSTESNTLMFDSVLMLAGDKPVLGPEASHSNTH